MHHLRLTLSGLPADRRRLAVELETCGATRLQDTEPLVLVWSTARPDALLEQLSARHPMVVVGVERFESLGDELVRVVLRGGIVTVLERRSILDGPYGEGPVDWGVCMDEGGEVLDPGLVHATAELVAAMPSPPAAPRARTPLESVVELSRALGRLCAGTDDPLAEDAPRPGTVSALLELASLALTVGAATGSMCAAEAVVARSWWLARACVHAGAETLWDTPGAASWPDWLVTLAASASHAIDAACDCQGAGRETSFIVTEHWPSSKEHFEAAAAGLLITCLQALALFGAADQTAPA